MLGHIQGSMYSYIITVARCTLMYTKPYYVMLDHIQGSMYSYIIS